MGSLDRCEDILESISLIFIHLYDPLTISWLQEHIVFGSLRFISHMQVTHCGLYVIMPHNLLDGQEIAPILDCKGCWSMPAWNHVRRLCQVLLPGVL